MGRQDWVIGTQDTTGTEEVVPGLSRWQRLDMLRIIRKLNRVSREAIAISLCLLVHMLERTSFCYQQHFFVCLITSAIPFLYEKYPDL